MAEVQKRQIAYKISIKELNEGSYIKQEGWKPNYILTKDGRKVSRANLLVTIVSIQSNSPTQMNITIDDGTGNLTIRTFEETEIAKSLQIGDIIKVIGRPREFNDIKYIVPEILKKIEDTKWIEVRQKELTLSRIKNNISEDVPVIRKSDDKVEEKQESSKNDSVVKVDIKEEISERETSLSDDIQKQAVSISDTSKEKVSINNNVNPKQKVYQTIKKQDNGDGVDIDNVILFSKVEDCEDVIKMLLKEGEIFEIKKGRLKVLE